MTQQETTSNLLIDDASIVFMIGDIEYIRMKHGEFSYKGKKIKDTDNVYESFKNFLKLFDFSENRKQ